MNRRVISCKLVEDSSATVGTDWPIVLPLHLAIFKKTAISESLWLAVGVTCRMCRFISCTPLETATKENMSVKIRLMLRNIMLGRLQFITG